MVKVKYYIFFFFFVATARIYGGPLDYGGGSGGGLPAGCK